MNINGTKNENTLHRQVEMSEAFSKYMQEYFIKHDIQAEKYVSSKFIKICNELGIQKSLLYRLRHTFATNHFTIGTQPKLVQQWLGHSSISMTLDTYTDIDKTVTKEKIIELYNNFYYIKN
ncbi:MAG: tyrosine-type recombinase/integrase [Christensenellales bacterium]